jgi:hypothetical protein
MFYDGFASMRPAPSRGFVTTFFVTYGAQYKTVLYGWEFLRRNPQYRADYNEFMRRFGAWLKGKGRRWPPSNLTFVNTGRNRNRDISGLRSNPS